MRLYVGWGTLRDLHNLSSACAKPDGSFNEKRWLDGLIGMTLLRDVLSLRDDDQPIEVVAHNAFRMVPHICSRRVPECASHYASMRGKYHCDGQEQQPSKEGK